MKRTIRLTENDLHRIVNESVKRALSKNRVNEGVERFLPHLKRTYENLYREYENWQYSAYKPQGIDDAIDAIIEAMHRIKDIIKGIEPSDDIPTWEDPQKNKKIINLTLISDYLRTSPIDLSNIWANLSDSLIFVKIC